MRRRALGAASCALVATYLSLAAALPSHAADEITIDHVETAEGRVSALLATDGLPAGTTVDPTAVVVRVDDDPVEVAVEAVETGSVERTVILAIDASNSMRGGRSSAAREAAKAFIGAAPPDVQIGLVTFAREVRAELAPTTDHAAVVAAIDAVSLDKGTSVYDAAAQSIKLAGAEGARSVLLLSDGADTGSAASVADVVARSQESRVIVDVVSLDQSPRHGATLSEIAGSSGGKVIDSDAEALSDVFAAQADALANQLLLTFDTPDGVGSEASIEVTVTVAGASYSDAALVAVEATDPGPRAARRSVPLVGRTALLLGMAALGVGLAGVLAVVLVSRKRPSHTQHRLDTYFGSRASSHAADLRSGSVANLRESAVAATASVLRGDFEGRLTTKLAGAGSGLIASEWILLHAGVATSVATVGLVIGGLPVAIVFLLLGIAAPWLYLRIKHSRRLAAFNAQLAETLTLMAGGLSAGLSLPQSVDTVVREGSEPMAGELRRALIEQRLGVPLEDTLEAVAARMDSEDFAWVVMAIRIQREVGGNLAELLNTVADTLREREFLRRQVKVLSAEGRFSAWILAGLPPIMFVYMLLVRPDFIRPLYTTGIGMIMLAAAVGLLASGGFVLSRLVKVEV